MKIRTLFFVLALLLGAGMMGGGVWADEANGGDVYLEPGDICNVTNAGNNKTVYITKAGEYTLQGNSDNIRVIIKSGGVKVYLADGLHIDPGAYADAGKSASAISVQHTSGTVTLISMEGADVYFGSHYMAPAIHKDGTKGKLVFETQNPDKPGTITAKSAEGSESAAIGSGKKKGSTGNIVFNSGNIYATADDYAAAIGGGNGSKGRSITINGGYVNAQGGYYGAGIGSGMYKEASDITINGGEVVAKGGKSGAGIGSGQEQEVSPIKGEHIKITGGKVTATGGFGAAGIGGGENADGEYIEITGGDVTATGGGAGAAGIGGGGNYNGGGYGGESLIGGDGRYITISGGRVEAMGYEGGAGIGGGNGEGNGEDITISGGSIIAGGEGGSAGIGGAKKGRAKNITITGGKVYAGASEGGAGIGGGSVAWGRNIRISGGFVDASGGQHGDGIGGGKKHEWWEFWKKDFTNSVFISGGTVMAYRGKDGSADIGGRGDSTVSITGGSVNANVVSKQAKNQAGDRVYKTTVTFYNGPKEAYYKIDSLNFTSETPAYGTNDIVNVSDKECVAYLWLPKKSGVGVESGVLTEGDGDSKTTKKYTAMEIKDQTTDPWTMEQRIISPGTSGTMYPPNNIILDGGRDHIQDGSATGDFMQTKLGNFDPVDGSITGMHVEGYSLSDNYEEYIIADTEGNLIPGVDANYVNADGKWVASASQVVLYAVWSINYYNIHFDSNKPDGAVYEVAGKMEDQRLQYSLNYDLNPNQYQLRGWKFTGWNTQPDGTGTSYADKYNVMDLTAEHDATVTLYAQWEPMEYTVTFNAGEGSGGDYEQMIKYDTPTELTQISEMKFSNGSKVFMGWARKTGTIGQLHDDQAVVFNLCTLNGKGEPEGYTLEAQWHDINQEVVMVTLDGEAKNIEEVGLTGGWDQILLQKEGENTRYEMKAVQGITGVYAIENLPADGQSEQTNNPPGGEYNILLGKSGDPSIDPFPTGRTIKIDNNQLNVAALDYCTVEIEMEQGRADWGSVWLGDGDGDKSIRKTVLLKDEALKINCEITKAGCRFVAYTASYHAPDWQDNEPNQTITINGRTAITAHVEPIRYTVEFDANAADFTGTMENQDFVYGHPQNLYTCQYEREGYVFAGWTATEEWKTMNDLYKDGETIGETTDIEDNLTTTHGGTVMLYAHWTPIAYDIFYDSNGADSGIQLTTHRSFHDSKTRLFSMEKLGFSMENYHFTGWNTKSGGDGTAYDAEQEVRNLSGGEDSVTLYAQWKHDSYTIHYDGNGGEGSMLDETFWTDTYEPLHASVFQKEGYSFAGWNTRRDGTGTAYEDGAEVADLAGAGESITLYAQWKGNPSPESPTGEEGPVDEGSPSDGGSRTGDDSDMLPWVIMAATSAVVGAGTLVRCRRKPKDKNN